MKKFIVTGGLGFIGSNLIKYLIKKKYFVINIDKITYSANAYNLKNINKKNYVFFKIDINNRNQIYRVVKKYKPSAIFNLAAETHVDRSIDKPKNFINANILGTYNLLESILNYKKKWYFVHICQITKYQPTLIVWTACDTCDRQRHLETNF